nr:MAG: hypothetical protein [Bacteriophage sp.]
MPKRICESVESAINSICWYNGYGAEILNLAEEIKKSAKTDESFRWKHEIYSEEHVIWMLIVGRFGEWGSSINGGWIYGKENKMQAYEWIMSIFKDDIERNKVYIKNDEGIWEDNEL